MRAFDTPFLSIDLPARLVGTPSSAPPIKMKIRDTEDGVPTANYTL
jgi:hypothetical protein